MHVRAEGDKNVAVRVELIQYLIDEGTSLESYTKNRKKYTYADASYKEHYRQLKWRGGVVDLKRMRDGKYAVVLSNGEATYGWGQQELAQCFGPTVHYEKDADYFHDLILDSLYPRGRSGPYIDFDDENADVLADGTESTISKSTNASCRRGTRKNIGKKKTKATRSAETTSSAGGVLRGECSLPNKSTLSSIGLSKYMGLSRRRCSLKLYRLLRTTKKRLWP